MLKYFDFAATTPIDPEVLSIYQEVARDYWGNTSSLHDTGTNAKQILESCREKLAAVLQVPAQGIYFTSSGTEANQLAITSLAFSQGHKGKHIITSMAEHPSVGSSLDFLKDFGYTITKLPFNQSGQVDIHDFNEAIQTDTVLITISHVNNEIGSIQPIEAIYQRIKDRQILLHSDCIQSFGKMEMQPISSLVNSMSISAHKIYGPKGVGAVYIQPDIPVKGLFPNQTHEHGFRGGTVNTPGIAAFVGAALKASHVEREKVMALRNLFITQLTKEMDHIFRIVEAPFNWQNPYVLGVIVKGLEGQWVMLECNRKGFAISTGSACGQSVHLKANTLLAMGYSQEEQKEFIRISFGRNTKGEDVKALANTLKEIAQSV